MTSLEQVTTRGNLQQAITAKEKPSVVIVAVKRERPKFQSISGRITDLALKLDVVADSKDAPYKNRQ